MIKFFRKIRQNLLLENKTGKYLKYAIGEIALVVIGILIALQINNWNEERQNHNNTISIFKDIQEDLLNDIRETDRFLKLYANKQDSISLKIIKGEYNQKDYLDSLNSNLPYIGTFDYPLVISEQSFSALSKNIIPSTYKTIIKDLNSLYVEDKHFLNQELEELKSFTYNFQENLFNKHWFRELLYDENITKKATSYFSSEAYKSKIMLFRDRLDRVEGYANRIRLKAIQNYLVLNEITQKKKKLPKTVDEYKNGSLKMSESYRGLYTDSEKNSLELIEENGLLFWYNKKQIYFDKFLLTELKKDSLQFVMVNSSSVRINRNEKGEIEGITVFSNGEVNSEFRRINND
tara:strand:- start:1328 stop:2371 length:1044 start_codon:yes stop_codon:yes gene_type:complete